MNFRRRKKRKHQIIFVCLTVFAWILVMAVCALNWKKLGEAERTDAFMDKYREEKRQESKKQREQEEEKNGISSNKEDRETQKKEDSKGEEKDKLLLVNRNHPLPEGYEPDLVWLDGKVGRIAVEAYDAATDFINGAKEAGYDVVVASAYRGYEYQENLVEEDVATLMRRGYCEEEAYEEVYKETMPPGCSEHQTGLAMDLVGKDYEVLHTDMVYTETNQWLRKHCVDYGFILRYPEDKEDVTGVNYEPWHFRYVGSKTLAKKLMKQGITLEEYLEE